MGTNKKIMVGLIAGIVIITGVVLVGKFVGLKKDIETQSVASNPSVKDVPVDQAKPEVESKIITIPASYVSISGTVISIDIADKTLVIKTDAGKNLSLVYNEKTSIYQMKNKTPENKTEADIVKGKIISVQYDSANNVAASIMLGGRWIKI